MKVVFLLLCIIGAICAQPAAPPVHVTNEDQTRNNITITITTSPDGAKYEGWAIDKCSRVYDSPEKCAMSEILASNDSNKDQSCMRNCLLSSLSAADLLEQTASAQTYQFMVNDTFGSVSCFLAPTAGKYLVGYDIKIHYLWFQAPQSSFIKVISCKVQPTLSDSGLKSGEEFIATRTLVMDAKINVITIMLIVLVIIFASAAICCTCFFCFGCFCLKICCSSSKRQCRHPINRSPTPMQKFTYQVPQEQNRPYFVLSQQPQQIQMIPIQKETV